MKNKVLSLALVLSLSTSPALFAGAAPDACCAAAKPATPVHSCCATPPPAASAPVSDRSIYQLDAAWTNDSGQPVALASLRGRPVVLAMFFASCSYACPLLVNDMRRIADALPADVREKTQFVLVSFDSERDTPEALRLYRERSKLDAAEWTLLHGDDAEVQELAMLLGVKFKRDARGDFSHSNLITVLNAAGEIVHQRNGLQGEVAEAAAAVRLAAK